MKTKIYIPVSVEDELPKSNIAIKTDKDFCLCYIDSGGTWYGVFNEGVTMIDAPKYWLKEVELTLPSDEEIEGFATYKSGGGSPESNDERIGIILGIKYLRKQITNQLKIK